MSYFVKFLDHILENIQKHSEIFNINISYDTFNNSISQLMHVNDTVNIREVSKLSKKKKRLIRKL